MTRLDAGPSRTPDRPGVVPMLRRRGGSRTDARHVAVPVLRGRWSSGRSPGGDRSEVRVGTAHG
jgi:hypothetical protein